MQSNSLTLPAHVRQHFSRLGYCHLCEELPEFGGIIIYIRTKGGCEEAAYYLAKRSTLELVFSDELRLCLDFLERRGISLRYAVTNSDFTDGARLLAAKEGITLLGP